MVRLKGNNSPAISFCSDERERRERVGEGEVRKEEGLEGGGDMSQQYICTFFCSILF